MTQLRRLFVPLFQEFLFLLAIFICGKLAFMLTQLDDQFVRLPEILQVLYHGLGMDLSTVAYMMALPLLLTLLHTWWRKFPLRAVLRTYYILVHLTIVSIIVVDLSLYPFWGFKLDATVFNYLDSLSGVTASVPILFVVVRLFVTFVAGTGTGMLAPIPEEGASFNAHPSIKEWLHDSALTTVCFALLGGLFFLMMRGGMDESTMNVGKAYFSERTYLNHAAVNPVFSLMSSLGKNEQFSQQFQYYDDDTLKQHLQGLYPQDTEDVTETLLNTSRPNVLLIIMEGFGGHCVEQLGGVPGVAPCYEELIHEGVFFDHVYAGSFRTDRGMVCTLSGDISYPTTSIMKMPGRSQHLPSIAATLHRQGYATDFLYGGDIDFTGTRGYLISMGYQHITSEDDFTHEQMNESKWGVHDSTTFSRLLSMLQERSPQDGPWHTGFLTLSSHEPFDVPYHRLEDKTLNAFAYTDHCLGQFIKQFKQTPQWDNTLIVLIPDHGFRYNVGPEEPAFYRIPMLWLGGAVQGGRTIHTIMSQSDLAATLLSQLQMPHTNFRWSRNVLSRNYTHPCAYSSFPSGIHFVDGTGTSSFDIKANQPTSAGESTPDSLRIQHAKAILQQSYRTLDEYAAAGRQKSGN